MNGENIPRWFLMLVMSGAFIVVGFVIKKAYSDIEITQTLAEKHDLLIPIIEDDIREIKDSQKLMDQKLEKIWQAVRR